VRVLVEGASGGIGRQLVSRLLTEGCDVFGIDRRPWRGAPIEIHRGDLRTRSAEQAFRAWRPDVVVHMEPAAPTFAEDDDRQGRLVEMTRAVFGYSRTSGASHCVFVGRHTYYGAGPSLPLFHVEDEPASEMHAFPRLADLVAADLVASNAIWRFPELTTTILRLCYTLGPTGHGTLGLYLRARRVPLVWGFDPLFQFMHEEDAVSAIMQAIEHRPRGVFNIAGPPPVPLSRIVRAAGRIPVQVPEFALAGMLGRFGLPELDRGSIAHLKYPVVVDARTFGAVTGFAHAHGAADTIRGFRDAFPPSA
jgi:UDP-glucose 4-epimerase